MLKLDTSGEVPQLYLYGEIARQLWFMEDGEVISAQETLGLLDQVDPTRDLHVRINSAGGDVFEGVAIYNALARRGRVHVYVDALAASIASVIAMAGDKITMAGNAMLMVHRAWTIAMGDAEELEKVVAALRKIDSTITDTYAARVGGKSSREEIEGWLAAETWMDPAEAIARGFADESVELKQAPAAKVPQGKFRNTPTHLIASGTPVEPPQPPERRPEPKRASSIPAIAARLHGLKATVGR